MTSSPQKLAPIARRTSERPPLAANDVCGTDTQITARLEVAGACCHARGILLEAGKFSPIGKPDTGHRRGVREQDGLQKDLIDSVRGFGSRPPPVRSGNIRKAIAPAGYMNAGQLVTSGSSPQHHVIWIVIGQPGGAHRVGETQSTERLHGSGRDMIALDAWWFAGPAPLHDETVDSSSCKVHRKAKTHWATTDDQNFRLTSVTHKVPGTAMDVEADVATSFRSGRCCSDEARPHIRIREVLCKRHRASPGPRALHLVKKLAKTL